MYSMCVYDYVRIYDICYNFKIFSPVDCLSAVLLCSFLQGLLSYLNGETGICYCTF